MSAKLRESVGNGLCLQNTGKVLVMVCVCKTQGKCWLRFVSAKHRASDSNGLCLLKHRAIVGNGLCLLNTGQVLVMVCVCKTQGNCWLRFVSAKHRAIDGNGLCLLKHRASVGNGLCLLNTGQVLVMVCVCKTPVSYTHLTLPTRSTV